MRADVGAATTDAFVERAFRIVVGRVPTVDERSACATAIERWRGLDDRAADAEAHVVWALLNHNDFVTLR